MFGYYEKSNTFELSESEHHHKNKKITFITHFFIDNNPKRTRDIRYCLKKIEKVSALSQIILLNDRVYTNKEIGITSDKIHQVNIGKKLTYKAVFDYIESLKLKGYIIFAKPDIFVDESISVLKKTNIHLEKSFVGLLRYNYNTKTRLYKIFGPRFDTQDAWILHSNFNVIDKFRNAFDFELDCVRADNKVLYLMKILGYKLYNTPLILKIFQVSETEKLYKDQESQDPPCLFLDPPFYTTQNVNPNDSRIYPYFLSIMEENKNFTELSMNDNDILRNYIENKLSNHKNFIIPSVYGIESDYARVLMLWSHNSKDPNDIQFKQANTFLNDNKSKMFDKACVSFSNDRDKHIYSQLFISAFANCDIMFGYELYTESNSYLKYSQEFYKKNFKKNMIWARVLDVYNYLYNKPWTNALKGKRLLFVSDKADIYEKQSKHMKQIYKRNIFPDCKMIFHKMDYFEENLLYKYDFMRVFSNLINLLNELKGEYDVILTDCKGYNNLLCDFALKNEKSCIYVGEVMRMYFGVIDKEWSQSCKDILLMFKNKHWYDEEVENIVNIDLKVSDMYEENKVVESSI